MILYRYLASHWIDTLRDGRLKVARPYEFNDPYDCLGICVGRYPISTLVRHFMDEKASVYNTTLKTAKKCNISIERAAEALAKMNADKLSAGVAKKIQDRKHMEDIMFLLCFSSCSEGDSGHSLMWSHYANKCKGVRLGFDFGGEEFPYYLNSVKYSCERASLNLSLIHEIAVDPEYTRFNEENLLTKSIDWSYEREYRMMIDDKHSEEGPDKDEMGRPFRFWRYKPEYLQTVDLGFGIDDNEKELILSIIKEKYPCVKVRRLCMSERGYSFNLVPLN